jgi:hypothetical protein
MSGAMYGNHLIGDLKADAGSVIELGPLSIRLMGCSIGHLRETVGNGLRDDIQRKVLAIRCTWYRSSVHDEGAATLQMVDYAGVPTKSPYR